MNTRRCIRFLLACAALTACVAAHATTVLTFDDEVAFGDFSDIQHPAGIHLSVSPAGGASYGTGFAFDGEFVQGPAIQITSGSNLRIEFLLPATFVQFGLRTEGKIDYLGQADLTLLTWEGNEALPFVTETPFSVLTHERQLTYVGDGLKRIEITYGFALADLYFDNLIFVELKQVPEPPALALLGLALLGLCVPGTRRRKKH